MSYIGYKKNNLFVERVSVKKLASRITSPFYLYSKGNIVQNYKSFLNNFKKSNPLICFSVKANSNIQILKILKKMGSGADVVSGGELLKAIKSGIKPNKIVFSGVGKTEDEIKLAIKKNILLINVESENEAILINKISAKLNKKTSIGIRLNPDINAPTHKKISTGKAEDKFGLSKTNLISFCLNINKFKNLKLNAISVHIGSQILKENPFKKTLKVLEEIIKKTKINFRFVDLGGGFGITYQEKDKKLNLRNYSILVEKFRRRFNCNIIFEPGRAIIGNTAILVSKIQYLKKGSNKTFAILNAGMNDFMRTALYDAVHNILPIVKNKKKNKGPIEFVGPICETSCKFVKYNNYQKVNQSDHVAIADVGAYGASLSSNYNTKPLIAEIIINKNKAKIIRKKQDLKILLSS
ncbi:MAG: diaminopimelate decarboxylase [Pelagibacteraceae bacterium TMED216]|nr:MAG: diaminopimelate decarboxylase [Pelagibacteraceae bacterium TMED216]|tara:strand:- start:4369 stop:5598 length:1230 start_codon:yes stop_codon:yes gene_type:complete